MAHHAFEGFTPISSDHLDGARYSSLDQMMYVRFQNGYVYAVHGVSPEDFRKFMDAPSQGAHYHAVIKPNYHIERVK